MEKEDREEMRDGVKKKKGGYIHRYSMSRKSDLFVSVTFRVTKHTLLEKEIMIRSGHAAVAQKEAINTNGL